MLRRRRPISRFPRELRKNKICFSRIRQEVLSTSQAIVILRPEDIRRSKEVQQRKIERVILEGEG